MSLAPYNPFYGQHIKTGVDGQTVDHGFIAHYVLPAAGAIAADDDYLVTAKATTAVVQDLDSADFANELATPKVLSVKSVTVGQTGDVLITGTNQAGEVQTETIAIDDNGTKNGTKVFATVDGIQLPAARYQSGKVDVLTAAITKAGNITATVTTAGGANTTAAIALDGTEDEAGVAAKIAAAITNDATIGAIVSGSSDGASVIITALAFAANDAAYDITITDTGGTGATVGAYEELVSGIPSGNLTVGVLGSFGIPYALPHDTIIKILNNGTATTVAAGSNFDSTDVNKNYIQPTAALAAAQVDVYLIV